MEILTKAGRHLIMRVPGIILSLLGASLLITSLLADTLRIGEDPLAFGWKQIVGVVFGTMMILVGFILCLPKVEKNESDGDSPSPQS